MKIIPLLSLALLLFSSLGRAVEILPIPYRVVAEYQTFVRDATDRRYSIWTDDESKIAGIIKELGLPQTGIVGLKLGEIFAVFLNDKIEEDLIQIARNSATKSIFADYADSGDMFKLGPLSKDKKYTHVTAVIFSPSEIPTYIGMRGMISNGLSEKK